MKRAFTLLELLIVVAIIALMAAFLFPVVVGHGKTSSHRSSCQSNLKQIGLGFMMYVQDYNALFPPTQSGTSLGWANAVQPYIKSWQVFQCPSPPNKTQPATDYFFNSRLSRGFAPNIKAPSRTILLGEGSDDAPTWANLRQLPPKWLLDKTSPAFRHLGTANYLFADGHVKAFKPNAISNASSKTHAATFAVR